MIKAVIFDIDGTLVDSVDLHALAWQKAFAHFGLEIPYEEVRHQIGKGGDQLMPVFLSQDELNRFGDRLEEYRSELYRRDYLPEVQAFPGVRALFERIKAEAKEIALASSAKRDELAAYERIADIEDLVDVVISADDVEKSKPHPDVFAVALERLGQVAPDNVLVIGDTPYDAEAARKAGLRTVGLRCGGFPEAELRSAGCIAIYDNPDDLLAHYDESPLAQPAIKTARS